MPLKSSVLCVENGLLFLNLQLLSLTLPQHFESTEIAFAVIHKSGCFNETQKKTVNVIIPVSISIFFSPFPARQILIVSVGYLASGVI